MGERGGIHNLESLPIRRYILCRVPPQQTLFRFLLLTTIHTIIVVDSGKSHLFGEL